MTQYIIKAKSDKFGLKVKVEADGKERWFLIMPNLFQAVEKGDLLEDVEISGDGKFTTITQAKVIKVKKEPQKTIPNLLKDLQAEPTLKEIRDLLLKILKRYDDKERTIVRQTIWKLLAENYGERGSHLGIDNIRQEFLKVARELEQEFWKHD